MDIRFASENPINEINETQDLLCSITVVVWVCKFASIS